MKHQLLKLFAKPTPHELAVRELVEAKRAKLEAETGRDWAASMVAYNEARITRLEASLREGV
jgi:hypothetical protein